MDGGVDNKCKIVPAVTARLTHSAASQFDHLMTFALLFAGSKSSLFLLILDLVAWLGSCGKHYGFISSPSAFCHKATLVTHVVLNMRCWLMFVYLLFDHEDDSVPFIAVDGKELDE